jgi:hypothetical protein
MPSDARPSIMATGDMTGDDVDDVLLTATHPNGDYRIYLYENPNGRQAKRRRPTGTGLNFTLY